MLRSCLSKKSWPAWLLLGLGVLSTALATLHVKQVIEQDAIRQFDFACDPVIVKIEERLAAYALILRGGSALFAASGTVSRDDWHSYVSTLRAEVSIPGVQGIGFAQLIPTGQLAAHTARIRAEGFPDYSPVPPGIRPVQTSIIYLEPFSGRNLRAFGYDMYSETIRRKAMDLARDSGEATLSGKVRLKQETNENAQAGVLMYVPVYLNDRPKETALQRRAALTGWAYSPYRMNDLMSGILHDWENREGESVDLHIYDGQQASADALLFDSKPTHTPDPHSLFYLQREIRFNGHPWSLVFDRAANISGISYSDAWATLSGGLTLSMLMFGLMLSRINTSASAARIANKLTEELRQREIQLRESELLYRTVADFTSDWEFWIMPDDVLKYVSPSCEQITGYSAEEFYIDPGLLTRRIHPDDQALYAEHTQHTSAQGVTQSIDFRYCTKSGEYRWLSHACRSVYDTTGKSLGRRTCNRDITERKQTEEQVSKLAFYDALTQLPNRRLLNDRLDQSIAACGRSGNYGALIFLDLDNFKPLNDSQGHAVGDLLLVEVATRLKNCVRDADTVSRFGGDEFVVMLHELDQDKSVSASQAGVVAEKIRLALSLPYLLTTNPEASEKNLIEHLCTASIGVTLFNHEDARHEDILTWADTAMYQAKEAGRNQVKFYATN